VKDEDGYASGDEAGNEGSKRGDSLQIEIERAAPSPLKEEPKEEEVNETAANNNGLEESNPDMEIDIDGEQDD
jgi:hypothetical protein